VDGSPATTANHPFWSAGADGTGASEPSFSVGAWINPVDDANNKAILTRIDPHQWLSRMTDAVRFPPVGELAS